MNIDQVQSVAVRRFAGADLRKAGIDDIDALEPHALTWAELNQRHRDLGRIAQGLADKLSDSANAKDAEQLNAATDALLDLRQLCDMEKDYRTQLGDRGPRASGGSPFRPVSDGTARGADDGTPGPDPDLPERLAYALRSEQRFADLIPARERRTDLTEGGLLRAMVLGGRTDAERRALAEGTDSAGGYTVPDILSARMIDRLRAKSVVVQAGARSINLESDQNYIAKVLTDPVPGWRAENASIAESDATFSRVALVPKSLAVICRVSRELLEDSLNIDTVLPDIIAKAFALEVDRVSLFGSGSGAEPQGLVNISGIGSTAVNDQPDYADLLTARTALLTANAPAPTAFIMHPRDEGYYTRLLNGNGDYLQPPAALRDIPFLPTTSVPVDGGTGDNEGTILSGYFPHMLLGFRNTLRIEVLKERYADVHQYGFVGHLRYTVALEQATAFHKLTGTLPEGA